VPVLGGNDVHALQVHGPVGEPEGWPGRGDTEVRYFGDLDENGLRIPASAGRTAEGSGLLPVRPAAGLYGAMFSRGKPQPGQRRVPSDSATSLAAWLAPAHREEAVRLLCDGYRLAQEWVGLSYLSGSGDWLRDLRGDVAEPSRET
jgi:hypothetical protein